MPEPSEHPSPATVQVLDPRTLAWDELGVEGATAQIKPVVTTEHSTTLGAGLCRFEAASFAWTLTYDECIHVLEGAMEIHRGETVLRASAGDVVFLAAGSDVTYVFPGVCRLFYAAYPVDWQERMEAGGA